MGRGNGTTTTLVRRNALRRRNGAHYGQTEPLELGYFFLSIRLCNNLTTMGTAFINPTGCITFYENPAARTGAYDTFLQPQAATDLANYTDVMAGLGRAVDLGSSITLTQLHIGSYNWGIITWMRPVKFKCSVPLYGGGNLYSNPGTESGTPSGGMYPYYATTSSVGLDVNSHGAEGLPLGMVTLNNGGNFFAFQQPLVIDSNDVANGRFVDLVLAFDPTGMIKGSDAGNAPFGLAPLVDTGGRGIQVPMVDLSPIPIKRNSLAGSLASTAEVYELALPDSNQCLWRLTVWLNTAGIIMGTSLREQFAIASVVDAPEPTGNCPMAEKIQRLNSTTEGVNMLSWDGSVVIGGFQRMDAVGVRRSIQVKQGGLVDTTYKRVGGRDLFY